jgi:hypothetical protein
VDHETRKRLEACLLMHAADKLRQKTAIAAMLHTAAKRARKLPAMKETVDAIEAAQQTINVNAELDELEKVLGANHTYTLEWMADDCKACGIPFNLAHTNPTKAVALLREKFKAFQKEPA